MQQASFSWNRNDGQTSLFQVMISQPMQSRLLSLALQFIQCLTFQSNAISVTCSTCLRNFVAADLKLTSVHLIICVFLFISSRPGLCKENKRPLLFHSYFFKCNYQSLSVPPNGPRLDNILTCPIKRGQPTSIPSDQNCAMILQ